MRSTTGSTGSTTGSPIPSGSGHQDQLTGSNWRITGGQDQIDHGSTTGSDHQMMSGMYVNGSSSGSTTSPDE